MDLNDLNDFYQSINRDPLYLISDSIIIDNKKSEHFGKRAIEIRHPNGLEVTLKVGDKIDWPSTLSDEEETKTIVAIEHLRQCSYTLRDNKDRIWAVIE
jgi:hypothetical protein